MIFMDHNSTTALNKEVAREMYELSLLNLPLNPSSIHTIGRGARSYLENARSRIARVLNIELGLNKYKIIFTSSGTEANNLIINNFARNNKNKILISPIEHKSIYSQIDQFSNISLLKLNSDGLVDLEYLEYILSLGNNEGQILISVMSANNETGIIQPIEEISAISKKYSAYFHTDSIQSIGKTNINISDISPDFATISAHKIGGPVGAAALIARDNIHIYPLIMGGGQERGARAGTENVIAINGFAKSLEIAINNLSNYIEKTSYLRDSLEKKLASKISDILIIGQKQNRLPNTSLIIMKNVTSANQLIQFDLNNIAVSSGSACSSGKTEKSHVLSAMSLEDDVINSAIRVSLGVENNENDVDHFVDIWEKIYRKNNLKGIKNAS